MAKKGRGTRNHGHGKHHRSSGRRGGFGYAGVKDVRWILTIKGGKILLKKSARRGKYGHFGKYGFTRGKLKKEYRVINLSWLNEHFEDGATVDITELGYEKLLGSGKLEKKLKIIAPAWSKSAEEKVKAVGGEIIPPNQSK